MPATVTYGRVAHGTDGRGHPAFAVRAVPHVAQRLKRVFARADAGTPGVIFIRDTLEVARDLAWFMERWPLAASDDVAGYIAQRSDEHRSTEQAVAAILGGYVPPNEWREPAMTPRGYQLAADALVHRTGWLLLADDLGLGKAQPLDAPVLTPAGFRPMGAIKRGDTVIAGDGTPTRVTAVFPQGGQDCYRVTFSDGAAVECNDQHLWWVSRRRRVRSKVTGELLPRYWRAKTLRELIDGGLFKWKRQAKWHIPMVAAPDLDGGGNRPLDPYLLGVLLGDGGFTGKGLVFTTADAEILASVEAAVPLGVVVKQRARYEYRLVRTEDIASAHPVIGPLRDLGLWGHTSLAKFVPEPYKLSPATDRLAILQGLMDTDGAALPMGTSATAQFYSSSRALAEDVRWLAESLGGTGRLTSKFAAGRDRYTVTVKLPQPLNPFRLSRKAKLWGDGHETLPPTRGIVSAEMVGRKPMQCIAVEHSSRLYVTDRFAVTHNTFTALLRLRDPEALPAVVVCPVHLCNQWLRELGKSLPWLRGHIATKGTPYDPAAKRGSDGRQPDVLIMSYAKFSGWADHLAGTVQTTVFDECHELRTGEGTYKWAAAANVSWKARYRIGCSATPVHGYGDEIWNVIAVLDPDALGAKDEFLREWCGGTAGIAGHRLVTDPAMLGGYLRDAGMMLARTRKELHMELPDPITIEQPVDTNHATIDEVAQQVADQARILVGEIDADFTARGRAAREIDWRLRQATGVAKAPYAAEFIKLLLESEERVVVWAWHREVYEILLHALRAYRPVLYTGTESPAMKDRNAAAFCGGGSRVLLMSLRSGAGLDGLQKWCSVGAFAELDWSPEAHNQCIGRLARDGQPATVVAYYLTSDAGTDPLMCDVLGLKRQQSVPIRRPDALPFAGVADSTDRARRLAADVLARIAKRSVKGTRP